MKSPKSTFILKPKLILAYFILYELLVLVILVGGNKHTFEIYLGISMFIIVIIAIIRLLWWCICTIVESTK